MKRGVSVAVIIAICSLSSFSQSAVADQKTPPPLPSGILEQFKKDMDAFNFAMALRDQQISEINQSFYLAINKANQDARSAMQIASKPEQKISVITVKKGAVAAAIYARESAIIALGQQPIPPIDPMRMQKGYSKQKEKQEKQEKKEKQFR
jgi:hypothetical protein